MSFDITKQEDKSAYLTSESTVVLVKQNLWVEIILFVTAIRNNTPLSVSKLKSVLRKSSDLVIGKT